MLFHFNHIQLRATDSTHFIPNTKLMQTVYKATACCTVEACTRSYFPNIRLFPKCTVTLTGLKSYLVLTGSEDTRAVYACTLPREVAASKEGSWSGWDPTE